MPALEEEVRKIHYIPEFDKAMLTWVTGSIVPVPPGVMRNSWFPRKMAEYQTLAQLKELGDVAIERDSTFNPREMERIYREKKEARKQETLSAEDIEETQEIPVAPIEAAVPIESEAPIEPEILSVRSSQPPF